MDWMCCNSCWLKVKTEQSQFFLTQCGHVYCDKCVVKAQERCFQCGTKNTISLPLKEPLSPEIAHYFARPTDLLEKVVQAEQFQESQIMLCLKQAEINSMKYQSLKEAYWINAENLKKLCHKYNKLKMAIAFLQKENKNITTATSAYTSSQYQTPPNQINNSKREESYSRGYFNKTNQDNSKRNDEVFRVPTITRVPRSAGYFSASSMNSNLSGFRMNTQKSNYSNF